MTSFVVNGNPVTSSSSVSLLRFLRDELHITSAKDGCSEGACGTCTVLVDGIATKACTVTTGMLEGKVVTTVEGLSPFEKEVYTYAFGEAGAVQCGFCIPGMVIAAKALLDKELNPTEDQIRHAIRNNICRCTGYAKIVKAIELAAEIFRKGELPSSAVDWKIGGRVHRLDVREKVLATGQYPDDIYIEGMVHVAAHRSAYPRAKVLSIDTTAAEKAPGVVRVFTAEDVPGNKVVGHLEKDWNSIVAVGETTSFLGDPIALVAAETREQAVAAAKLIKVQYEVLEMVRNPEEASREGAPLVHENTPGNLAAQRHVSRGDAEKAIESADYVYTHTFSTPWTEHAFLEPECAVSLPDGDGVRIYSTDQGVFDTLHETAPMLGLPMEKVKVFNCLVGGGFGGKEDVTVQHFSAMVALLLQRPAKMKLSRSESLLFHPKRHPMEMTFTVGTDKEGRILGVKAKVIADTGAYKSLCGPVLERACTHASGPYNYQNFKIDGYSYYTNNPPAGAFRGFGVTQTCFGIETCLDRLADMIGITPWEIRYRNALEPGNEMPNGQIADACVGLKETLLAVKDIYASAKFAGVACAMKNAGVGVGIPDWGRVRLTVNSGKVTVHTAGSCIGQGLWTVLSQVICTVAGVEKDDLLIEKANTLAPDSGTTSGSRHTTVTGEAARKAALLLKEALSTKSLQELEGEEFYAEYLAKTDKLGADVPNPVSHVAYGFATQVCILDEETGRIRKMVAAHDVGRAINPLSVEGQIEGGVVMSMGFALRERYRLQDCKPLEKYGSLGLFRADEVPEIVPIIVEKEGLKTSSGAIGIGEITSIPTAPAIADAYYRYDGKERFDLPLVDTPYLKEKAPTVSRLPGKRLVVRKDSRCIECLECVRACASAFHKSIEPEKAHLAVKGKPVVCIQCGKCAKVCPNGAITKNAKGIWMVDKKKCTGCGECAKACPMKVMTIEDKASKCTACGLCAKACPMDVLDIIDNPV